jgi:hypothetical protein
VTYSPRLPCWSSPPARSFDFDLETQPRLPICRCHPVNTLTAPAPAPVVVCVACVRGVVLACVLSERVVCPFLGCHRTPHRVKLLAWRADVVRCGVAYSELVQRASVRLPRGGEPARGAGHAFCTLASSLCLGRTHATRARTHPRIHTHTRTHTRTHAHIPHSLKR